jgi:2-iminoacetate synthase ThiH
MTAVIRPLVRRAFEAAQITDLAERVLAGALLTSDELARLREADVLAVAALADLVRAAGQGDEVLLVDLGLSGEGAPAGLVHAQPMLGASEGATGLDVLREVALVRLATPASQPVAVSSDALGEGLAQAALTFGASVIVGTFTRRGTLPLAGAAATEVPAKTKKSELAGRVARGGRRPRWLDGQAQHAGEMPAVQEEVSP